MVDDQTHSQIHKTLQVDLYHFNCDQVDMTKSMFSDDNINVRSDFNIPDIIIKNDIKFDTKNIRHFTMNQQMMN